MQNTTTSTDINLHPIVLFDGVCNLCDGFVQFIIKRDPKGIFRFASLQSTVGQELLAANGMDVKSLSTVVLYEKGTFHTHSDVGLKVFRRLNGWWPVLYYLIYFPKPLRDLVYNWIARNRYRWFGKKEACMIPSPDVRARFLDW